MLVDAVGVTESLKHVAQPLDRERKTGFDRLIDEIAAGRRDDDAVSTLAARLASLDRKIDDKAREVIARAAGGLEPKALVHKLLDAIDPDTIEREAAARQISPEAAAEAFKEEACRPFDDPALRRLLKDIKRQTEIRIDTISTDAVISSGYDSARAQDTVERFRQFLAEHRDTLTALQILYTRPHATRRLDHAAIEELRDAMRRPPWLLEPVDIWRAYKRLDDDRVKGNPARALSDIVMLVRYALGAATLLEPLPATIAGRFNLWLGRGPRRSHLYRGAARLALFYPRLHRGQWRHHSRGFNGRPRFRRPGRARPRPFAVRRPPPPTPRRTATGPHRMSPDALSVGETRQITAIGPGPWELPDGWVWASLNEVTEPAAKLDPRRQGRAFSSIDLSAVEAGKIGSAQSLQAERAPSRARQLIKHGYTLFSGVRVYLKNIALVDEIHDGASHLLRSPCFGQMIL